MKADRKKIRLTMEREGMTVRDVAKAANLPVQTTAAIICGMSVKLETLIRIAQALDMGVADIAQGVVPVPNVQGQAGGELPQDLAPPLPAGQVRIDTALFAEAVARSGLTITQLAKRAGVSPGVVRHITRGAEAHQAGTVNKLADALGVAVCNIIKVE